ncbi:MULTISPECIES: hypothetical protein [Calothrix]|uniref:Uncharacterized protein n=2 Tax=Calothrix TaxID=1186 RepID=A0ABR8AF76_9CYAN|nr:MULTISPECIES: hypothetical protein [Calothrix]MBD2198601.1 hypothetical protein [Calothrix parietina FACHB-288]MBD2226944.1 hypothetical protein [Calothrix anomala FACHB-343]
MTSPYRVRAFLHIWDAPNRRGAENTEIRDYRGIDGNKIFIQPGNG